jgi:hypothetical protein
MQLKKSTSELPQQKIPAEADKATKSFPITRLQHSHQQDNQQAAHTLLNKDPLDVMTELISRTNAQKQEKSN